MSERSVTHSSFVIERHYPAAPERVFAAFSDPAIKRRWYIDESRLEVEEFQMDFRAGGSSHSRSKFKPGTPFPGMSLVNDTTYLDIVPGKRIAFAYTMSVGDRRISASLATVELLPGKDGTGLVFTEQGAFFEGSDGPDRRKQGWSDLLDRLASQASD